MTQRQTTQDKQRRDPTRDASRNEPSHDTRASDRNEKEPTAHQDDDHASTRTTNESGTQDNHRGGRGKH